MNKQHGFSAVELVLIIVIVGLLGGTGWYVLNKNKTDNGKEKSSTVQTTSEKPTVAKPATDSTADWVLFTSTEGKFTIKYPKTLVRGGDEDNVCSDVLMLGATASTAGHCKSDAPVEIVVYGPKDDKIDNYKLTKDSYPDLKEEKITVDGISGIKQTGTFKAAENQGLGPENGAKVVQYLFVTNGRIYFANYTQQLSGKDISDDFNTMITKTLTFSK